MWVEKPWNHRLRKLRPREDYNECLGGGGRGDRDCKDNCLRENGSKLLYLLHSIVCGEWLGTIGRRHPSNYAQIRSMFIRITLSLDDVVTIGEMPVKATHISPRRIKCQ